jgi:hypothetical protein
LADLGLTSTDAGQIELEKCHQAGCINGIRPARNYCAHN